MLRGVLQLERAPITLRTERLGLPRLVRFRADAICRRLWPGLVPIPHFPRGRHG